MAWHRWKSSISLADQPCRVGNDIVDLQDRFNLGKEHDQRFLSRVFTPTEQALIAAANQAYRMLWSLWAAKESVYKIVMQHDLAAIFSHSSFRVTVLDAIPSHGYVDYQGCRYPIRWLHQPEYVHALSCWPESGPEVRLRIARLPEGELGESSTVRAIALQLLAEHGHSDLEIRGRPPRLFRRGQDQAICLSLSHDGNWGAAAFRTEDRLYWNNES